MNKKAVLEENETVNHYDQCWHSKGAPEAIQMLGINRSCIPLYLQFPNDFMVFIVCLGE